jgi:TonB family protein
VSLLHSPRTARTNRLFAIFCGVSFAVHVVAVVVWIVFSVTKPRPPAIDQNSIKTRLVKLGKKRDEKLLPRLDAAKPPPKTNQKKVPTPVAEPPKDKAPTTEPEPEPAPSSTDILDQFKAENTERDLSSIIKDRLGEPLDEGHEEGSELGTDITGRLKANYNDQLIAKITKSYKLPTTLTDEERVRLRAVLYVSIGENGELLEARVGESSGNAAFDSAMVAAAKKAAPFSPPPIQLRPFYANGVGMNMCPITCK